MNGITAIILVLLALFGASGAKRGLIKDMRWVGAFVLSLTLTPILSPFVLRLLQSQPYLSSINLSNPILSRFVSVLVFIITVSLIKFGFYKLTDALTTDLPKPLKVADSICGAFLGVLKVFFLVWICDFIISKMHLVNMVSQMFYQSFLVELIIKISPFFKQFLK